LPGSPALAVPVMYCRMVLVGGDSFNKTKRRLVQQNESVSEYRPYFPTALAHADDVQQRCYTCAYNKAMYNITEEANATEVGEMTRQAATTAAPYISPEMEEALRDARAEMELIAKKRAQFEAAELEAKKKEAELMMSGGGAPKNTPWR
jgi:hypothetical protein